MMPPARSVTRRCYTAPRCRIVVSRVRTHVLKVCGRVGIRMSHHSRQSAFQPLRLLVVVFPSGGFLQARERFALIGKCSSGACALRRLSVLGGKGRVLGAAATACLASSTATRLRVEAMQLTM